jgi:hypothetical protein
VGSIRNLKVCHFISELKVKLDFLLESLGWHPRRIVSKHKIPWWREPIVDRVAPPESIGEKEPRPLEDEDEPESKKEQRSSVLFTPKQLEILLKMNKPDFGELVACYNPTLG